jgi:hypothetical protein
MKTHKRLYTFLNLRLFDGEGTGAGGAAPNGGDGAYGASSAKDKASGGSAPKVLYGRQREAEPPSTSEIPKTKEPDVSVTTDAEEARRAEFERLIKGDYKDLFDERVQRNINARFKEMDGYKSKAAQADALSPVLDLLASKYGVDGKNVDAIVKAIEEDDGYYEEEAADKGLSVEQLKYVKRMERENAELRRAAQERERQQLADQQYSQWLQQGDECKRVYPGFDFKTEVTNPETGNRFFGLIQNGVDVKTAYEVLHKDDIIGGAMQYTAQAVQQKTVNDIRARGMRPAENGGGGNSPAVIVKNDPKTFTKKDREEIARRALRGERIEL